jgi:hypothetical protein
MIWQNEEKIISLDDTILFGVGYDFFGLNYLWQQAIGKRGNYLIWKDDKSWSLYRDSDGTFLFHVFKIESAVKFKAEMLDK